jgi:hypothetical protein
MELLNQNAMPCCKIDLDVNGTSQSKCHAMLQN